MSICSCCIRRFIKRKVESNWFGWFDCDYPPEARVVGSRWYYDNVVTLKAIPLPTPTLVPMVNLFESEAVPQVEVEAEAVAEVEGEAVAEVEGEAEAEEIQKGLQALRITEKTKEEKKDDLKKRIKEIQKNAKPGKMSLKEIQAAFKEITNLKTQIHML